MARQITKGAWVFANPDTMGPIGPALAAAGVDMAGFTSDNAARVRAVANFLRQGLAFANLATLTGSVTAEAQSQSSPYVRPLVATGGTLDAELPAFNASFTQAEFVAAKSLANQIRTTILNAGFGTTEAAVDPVAAIHSHYVRKSKYVGGTAPAAVSAAFASYDQAEVQTLIDVLEWARATCILAGLADDAVAVDAISVVDDGGSTEQFAAKFDLTSGATPIAYDVPAAGLTDRNGTVQTGTTAAFSTNEQVATVHKTDATNFEITPVGVGRCSVYFGVVGNPRLREIIVTVADDPIPASIELTAANPVLDLSSDATEQLTWVVKNAAGFTLAAYTNDNTYVTFESAEPLNASVDANGLVTGLIVDASVIVTATFSKSGYPQIPAQTPGASSTVTFSDSVDFSVQA